MCGIAGLLARQADHVQPELVGLMTSAMRHRGPDAEGLWSEGRVVLGHRRLSIIDLAEAANQPLSDPFDRYRITFNGEIYNYLELRGQLADYPFQTRSDTEVLLAAYDRWGVDCLSRLNGMFAFAIWDRQTQQLFVARDRLGKKPFYFYFDEAYLLFASEVRALLDTGLVPRLLNTKALPTYLMYQTVPAPDTLVQGVRQLRAGHYALFANNHWQETSYWNLLTPAPTDPTLLTQATAVRSEARRLLQDAVRIRMISDVPLGAFLSGGVDSSALVALMAEQSEQPINTFTLTFSEAHFDESAYASELARRFRTRHTDLRVTPDQLLTELPQILASMDMPSGDGPNTYLVSKLTKEAGITVALSGLGGDEVFAGYSTFRRYEQLQQLRWLWLLPAGGRRQVLNWLLPKANVNKRNELADLPGINPVALFPLLRQSMTREGVGALLGDTAINPVADYMRRNERQLRDLPVLSQVTVSEIKTYTEPLLLRDSDQMSMAHALELRVPFLDYRLVEFLLHVPDSIKSAHPPKRLLVDTLHPLLPDTMLQRPKMGFSFPWEQWLKTELRPFCAGHLNRLAKRGIFDPAAIQDCWQGFLSGSATYTWNHVWLLVVLENWLETNRINGCRFGS